MSMPPAERRTRRERIKHVNDSKKSAIDTSAYPVYWMTRNANARGELATRVDVWSAAPTERKVLPSGEVIWLGSGVIGLESHLGLWTLPEATREARTYPETSREVIKVGDAPRVVAPASGMQ